MRHFVKYDNTKTYYYLTGHEATPEAVLAKYPAIASQTYVMETDSTETIMMGMDMLITLRTLYNIDSELTEDEAIEEIEDILNTDPEPELDNQTRIADALEDLVVLNMPDVEEE